MLLFTLALHTARRPTSFNDLRVIDDVEHPTYQAACQARHMLDDEQHWNHALATRCLSDLPRRLCHLFSIIFVSCKLSDTTDFGQKNQHKLMEDFLRKIRKNNDTEIHAWLHQNIINRCMIAIQDIVISTGEICFLTIVCPRRLYEFALGICRRDQLRPQRTRVNFTNQRPKPNSRTTYGF